jgi:hypothetical protein
LPGAAIFGRDMLFDVPFLANKDLSHTHEQFITGRKALKKVDGTYKEGTSHLLPLELQDMLLSMC